MKKYVVGLIGFVFLLIIYFYFFKSNNYTNDFSNVNNFQPKEIYEKKKSGIIKINLAQLDSLIKNSKDSLLHIYFFSYYCGPCVKSIQKKTYDNVLYDSFAGVLPTILISCDNYGTIDKLQSLIAKSKIEYLYILDNSELKVESRLNSFERLSILVKSFYPFKDFDKETAYPLNLIISNKGITKAVYTGSVEIKQKK